MSNSTFVYNVDLTFCIDATGSMHSIIDGVRKNARSMQDKIQSYLSEKEKHINMMRVRVVCFRDFFCDGDDAIHATPFYNIPDQTSEFERYIAGVKADGGGDEPENGLEAIALAINSDWTKEGNRQRHIVIVFSDASAHPIEKAVEAGVKPKNYPSVMPTSYSQLTTWWSDAQVGKMDASAQRLIIFAPDTRPWSDISGDWPNTVHIPSQAGHGLSEFDMDVVLEMIAGSI